LVTGKTEEFHQGLPVVTFTDSAGFERWLKSNGSKSAGIWLKLAKKGAPEKGRTKAEAIDSALCHGWIDGQLDACDDHYWLVRFTPRKPRSKWSRLNRARATELLALGQVKPHGLTQIEAAKADGRWANAYASASVAEVPPDLSAALNKNAKAAAFFSTLNGANRYSILHRIGAVKKAETRARKIAQFVEMLERGETIHK
jgi:uncharacterized protein YdeI (YjbR/CyaY-like superfamily)